MDTRLTPRAREEIGRLARAGLDWVALSVEATEVLRRVIPFDRSCWHLVDPGTVLLTGSLNQNLDCSGSWLAEHEYVIDDVNKWWFLASSGRLAGATSLATHGDLSRSARHRSHASYGIGDELRGAFVSGGVYWAAAGFLRDEDRPWFSEVEVRLLASVCESLAVGFRRSLLAASAARTLSPGVPGVIVFDEHGAAESISPQAEHWIAEIVEVPAPATAVESKAVRAVAARARTSRPERDPLELAARARVRTRSGDWLLLYGTPLLGGATGRTAVVIQPASPGDVAALVALAYGLSPRECDVTRLCVQGQSTKQMALTLGISAYTVQDHLKSIFEKTGVRSRAELVGQVFLEHYAPRWEDLTDLPTGWGGKGLVSAPEGEC